MNLFDYYNSKTVCDLLDRSKTSKIKCHTYSKYREILKNIKSDYHGVTLTFKSKFLEEDPLDLHRIVQQVLSNSTLWNKQRYYLFPEFTKNGNLHYHGVIIGCYEVTTMRMINMWRRKFGFVKPELQIQHHNEWMDYITKSSNVGLWPFIHEQPL